MIKLIDALPDLETTTAELVKIKCLFACYKNDDKVLFWVQDDDKAVISMTDGNMIIHNNGADIEELREFIEVLGPVCVYSDYETLISVGKKPKERINVMSVLAAEETVTQSDTLDSKALYNLLDVDGLSLPEYPDFAVDYCRRYNMGFADYFGISNKCAAITFNCGEKAIINGIASHEKGWGSIALKGVLGKNIGREVFVCCREKIKEFYLKNGYKFLYHAGYWVKE